MEKNIIISDPEEFEKTKKEISKQGGKKLHVLADFDRTLTYSFVKGEEVPSMISILRKENYLTEDYSEKAHALFDKYHPIEINPEIPLEEKKKAMIEWWKSHFDLLIKCKLNKKDLEKAVKSEKIKLRDGASEFFDMLHDNKIPLVILSSSGLGGDAISMYLKNKGELYDNIHVISNSYIWDNDGYAKGVKEPIIHSMNKAEISIKNYPAYKKIKNRKNVLLLGDNIEDLGMIEGFDYDNLIKIAFLNKNTEKNLELYKKNYDIIVLNDSDMAFVNKLLRELI